MSCIGDNLGSQAMGGGFKEGGWALRCCRQCMISHDDLGSKVYSFQSHNN